MYEVKVYDGAGKLKKVITTKMLDKRSDEIFNAKKSNFRNYKKRPKVFLDLPDEPFQQN